MSIQRSRIAGLLACAATLAACQGEDETTASVVNTYTVSREDLPINVKEGGELVAVNETVVRSQLEGNATILSLIPEGTAVKKGDMLVELDVSGIEKELASQEIAVEKARNALEQAKTQQEILEKQLETNRTTAESQQKIAAMELQKMLGAASGEVAEGKNRDMIARLTELVTPQPETEIPAVANADPGDKPKTAAKAGEILTANQTAGQSQRRPVDAAAPAGTLIQQVKPENYASLVDTAIALLEVPGDPSDPLERDMGEMANKILQQADQIRLAMAQLKVAEDTVFHSRRLAAKKFITRNELERDELDYQSQASKVTIAWNDLDLLINYSLERDLIELRQNLANATLEVERVLASNDAERKNSQFDVTAKQKEFEVAEERLAVLRRQVDNAIIYSPGPGLVVYSRVSRGRGDSESVEEGTTVRERQPIIILPDNSELKCEIKVQEAMIDKVRVGLPALISAEVRPNDTITGRVTYVAPVADSGSRWSGNDKKVYATHVLLDSGKMGGGLKAGMKASATITVDTIEDVLTVPIQAVRRDRAVNYIWRQTANGPEAVIVEVGAHNEEKVEITSGVSEGDRVYRTPPGGQADPKFPQPEAPEVDPAEVEAAAAKARAEADGGGDSRRGGTDGDEGNSRRRGGSRKAYTEMDAAEVAAALERLRGMADRMPEGMRGSMTGIIQALEANDLQKAQDLSDAMRAQFRNRSGSGGGGERSGRGGDRGERGGRDGVSRRQGG